MAWRILKPGFIERDFITMATSTRCAAPPPGLCIVNQPSLLGMVDPADQDKGVKHVVEKYKPVLQTEFISDVNESADRLMLMTSGTDGAVAEEQRSEEENMQENIHKTFSAVRNADYEGVDALLDEGVMVDSHDVNGNTFLLVAAQQNLKRISKLLLRRGANINVQNHAGNTVLHYCFEYSFTELGDYFMEKGADDSLTNAEGLTCYEGLHAEALEAI